MFYRIALAAACLFATASVGFAETVNETVKRGTPKVVGGFYSYARDDCRSTEVPQATIRQQAKLGRVEIRQFSGVVTQKGHPCVGSRQRGIEFLYTPGRGTVGADTFAIDIPFHPYVDAPSLTVRTVYFNITIQ